MERWVTSVSKASCAGCLFLSRAGPFPVGQAPRPPLYGNCGCSIEVIDVTGFSPGALIALGRQAQKNVRSRERLLLRAMQLRNREHTVLGKRSGFAGRKELGLKQLGPASVVGRRFGNG